MEGESPDKKPDKKIVKLTGLREPTALADRLAEIQLDRRYPESPVGPLKKKIKNQK